MYPYPNSLQLRPLKAAPREERTPHFAKLLVERISDTFHAPTMVLDGEGTIIASSEPGLAGVPFALVRSKKCVPAFRAAFYYREQPGEVIVCKLRNGEKISDRLAQVLIEMILDEIDGRHMAPARNEIKNKFIHDLLHGHMEDEETIHYYAELLRLDLALPRSVILIDAANHALRESDEDVVTTRKLQRRAQFVIDTVIRFFHLPDDLICAYLGNGQVAVLKACDSHSLATWSEVEDPTTGETWADLSALKRATEDLLDRLPSPAQEIKVGLGRYHPRIKGLAHSYADAQMALSLGRRFNETERIYCLDELGMAAFVGINHKETKVELAEHILSPLNDEPELLNTLHSFFAEDCSISITANQLSIHRNTLSYRLDKIASLTGLDPRHFDDAVQIRLALLLRTLYVH